MWIVPAAETINTGTDALITLSSSWGIGLTLVFLVMAGGMVLMGLYIWKVLPIRARRDSELHAEQLKEQFNKEIQLIKDSFTTRQPTEDDIKPETLTQFNNRFKAIWAELSKIEKRISGIETTCPQHKAVMSEVLIKLQAVNDALPQLVSSINGINDKVWEIAMKQGGKG
jgi:hypothetical protein